jgi:hypothetical protein
MHFATLPLFVACFSSSLFSQQFEWAPIPADLEVWSERAIPLDADDDGLLDVLILNAQGWEVPGDLQAPGDQPLPPTLLRNTGLGLDGNPVFVDATASFLPTDLLMHAKSGAVADLDGDGHDDLAIAVGFQSPQRLLIKDPILGSWLDESHRLPPSFILNSSSVVAGDLDDDGDLDLVFADAGPSTFSAPGGLARLLLNDGSGFFSDEPARLGAVPKIGAQNIKLVDLDQDLDLDLVVDGKSPVTQAYLNDGAAQFTYDDTIFPEAPGGDTYETEFADLDGDSDFDTFLMNWRPPYRNTLLINNLVPTGNLSFLDKTGYFDGPNNEDENDFVYLDVDDDGDFDLLVGALPFSVGGPPSKEKLLINTGVVGPGWFSFSADAFDATPDATIDLGLGDFDGDGDYDIVSVQGEYLPFRSLYHQNTGPADTRAPVVRQLSEAPQTLPASSLDDGWPRRAWIEDALVDDETVYIAADLIVDTVKGNESSSTSTPMDYVGGAIWRGVVDPAPSSEGLVGMDVSYHVVSTDPEGNVGTSTTETVRLCGVQSYGVAGPDTDLALSLIGEPVLGDSVTVDVTGGKPSTAGLLIGSFQSLDIPLAGGRLLVDPSPGAILVNVGVNGSGELSLSATLPDDDLLIGTTLFMQYVLFDDSQPFDLALSNGLEVVFCDS